MVPAHSLPSTDADKKLLSQIASVLRGADCVQDIESLCDQSRQRLLYLAELHGVEALLFAAIEDNPLRTAAGGWLRHQLKHKVQRDAVRELARKLAIRKILAELAAAGVPVLLLKGAALAYTVYQQPYMRGRGDLDLLIPEHQKSDANAALVAAGYEPLHHLREAGSFQLTYYPPAAAAAVGADAIDLHEKLNDHRIFTPLLSFDCLVANSIPVPALGEHARSPCPVHMMLHAAMHRAANFTTVYHAAGESVIEPNRLIWLYDIHLLAKAFTFQDWMRLAEFAEQHAIRQVCWDALQASAGAFQTSIPSDAAKRIGISEAKEPSAAYLRTGLANKLLTDIKAQPNLRARWQLAAAYALPARDFIRQKYDHKKVPLPALYLLHIARGIARLAHLRRA
jgi:hypothetical protein